ncbi:MAG: redoxin domain-containing protein [Bacteroidales bacterium]|nr:redoxin domain-containing protein [Bacteroidales bacterium]
MKKFILPILLVLFSIPPQVYSQGHEINITIVGAADSTLFFAYNYGDKKFVRDTLVADQNGTIVVKGDESLPGGVYLVVLPDFKYFEFLVSDDQKFSIQTDYNKLLESLEFTGSKENSAFLEYQQFTMKINQSNQVLKEKQKNNLTNLDSLFIIQDQLDQNTLKVETYLTELTAKYEGTFLGDLLNSMAPIDDPEIIVPDDVENPDSVRMIRSYGYFRDHYFDRVNFANSDLIRTPILMNKLNQYFNRMLVQTPDSIIPQVEMVVKKAKVNADMYQYVLVYTLNNYLESKIMGLDEVFVLIADKYYLSGEAPWVDSTYMARLNDRVMKVRPNLIGRKAQDLKMETLSGEWISLHQVDRKFIVVYFWEPNCGFCKEATPKLYEIYQKYQNKGMEVLAVYTQQDKEEWENYINETGYDWINAWDPDQQTYFRYYYDVYTTPTLYVLDRNKTIVAKRIDMESLEQMMNQLLN